MKKTTQPASRGVAKPATPGVVTLPSAEVTDWLRLPAK